MKLQEIPVEKVYANWFQPRKTFDKEKIKELAESILSNGLINPITVKNWRDGKYMIVSGERRWRAHKVAGLKTIQSFVKEYKDDGQFMIDSLIENIHREDLSPTEKGKFCLKIKKQMKLENNEQLAKMLSIDKQDLFNWIDDFEFRKSQPVDKNVPHKIIRSTRTLPDKERKEIIKFAEKEGKSGSFIEEDFVPVYKKANEDTRKALLKGDVSVEDVKANPEVKKIKKERTAREIGEEINDNLHDFKHLVDELSKNDNLDDLSKSMANSIMTTLGLHAEPSRMLLEILIERGAKPHPLIVALIKAKDGKL